MRLEQTILVNVDAWTAHRCIGIVYVCDGNRVGNIAIHRYFGIIHFDKCTVSRLLLTKATTKNSSPCTRDSKQCVHFNYPGWQLIGPSPRQP
jgi:hypothetical protein